jgi:hypothetical protein
MKFLVIFGAVLVTLCLAQSSNDVGDESNDDVETTESSLESDKAITEEDTATATDTQKPHDETIVKQSEIGNSSQEIKAFNTNIANSVEKLLAVVQINENYVQDLEECVPKLNIKDDQIQQLEAASEDLRKQIKAKDVEIEKQIKSIEDYRTLLTISVKKAKTIMALSVKVAQGKLNPILMIGENEADFPSIEFDFVLSRIETILPTA